MEFHTLTKKLKDLIPKAIEANRAYRFGNAIMPDKAYDTLADDIRETQDRLKVIDNLQEKLKVIDPGNELLEFDPYNIKVEVSDNSRKEKLPVTMASMNKVKTIEEIHHWSKTKSIPKDTLVVLTPKYDGLSLCVDEESNYAWTRGNGEEGQRSDEHLKKIGAYPKKENIFSFGEVVMRKSTFESTYSKDVLGEDDGFSNSRNLVAGKMNDKNAKDILSDCDYIRFGMVPKEGKETLSKVDQLDFLNEMNRVRILYIVKRFGDLNADDLYDLFQLWRREYEIDGIIIDINDPDIRRRLGRDTKNNPHFARAYKGDFEEQKDTKITNITWSISKQGYLKPVIQVETVNLDGANVTNVTAINAKFVSYMGIAVGETVTIKRSGMVIPKIVAIDKLPIPDPKDEEGIEEMKRLRERVDIDLPTHCPSCGEILIWNESGVELMCANHDHCPDQIFQRVVAFFEILDVDNMGEGNIRAFFDAEYDSVEDILNMTQQDMENIERFGKRKAEIVFQSIHNKMKDVPLPKLQHATGFFENLGSKKLVLVEDIDDPTFAALVEVDGYSEKSAGNYLIGLPKFKRFIENLPITIKEKAEPSSDKFKEMSIVFSGFRNKEWEEAVADGGGKISSSVSRNTSLLVVKVKGEGSSKEEKAEKLGVEIWDVGKFEEVLS